MEQPNDAIAPAANPRAAVPIIVGVAVSVVYVAAVAAVVIGVLRFTRDHVRRLGAVPGALLGRSLEN